MPLNLEQKTENSILQAQNTGSIKKLEGMKQQDTFMLCLRNYDWQTELSKAGSCRALSVLFNLFIEIGSCIVTQAGLELTT